jgi:hypothetical protein
VIEDFWREEGGEDRRQVVAAGEVGGKAKAGGLGGR